MGDVFRIQVSGHLDDRWSDWLDGLSIERQADGTTVLTGTLVDQAALHGVIARIRDLAVPLLSVERVAFAEAASADDQPRNVPETPEPDERSFAIDDALG